MRDEGKVETLLFLIQNVDPSFPPKKQKPRRSTKERVEAVRQEVGRLKETEVIREIFFLEIGRAHV